jgi:hypothetical protein
MVTEHSSESERVDHLYRLISSPRFLKIQGIGNEVPFFICPYLPEQENEMRRLVNQLVNRLQTGGISILRVSLYDLVIDLLKQRGELDTILESETEISKSDLLEMLQNVCDPEHYLVPEIMKKIEGKELDVLFITGVGEVFPYIRSHIVLSNMQSKVKNIPTVLFFPGDYSQSKDGGSSLTLFNRMQDNKYYRAFNIYTSEI